MAVTMNDTTDTDERGGFDVDRRKLLQLVGSAGVGLAVTTGGASARPHAFQFFGCSQVCADSDGNLAVVATDDGYECRSMDKTSDRNNVPWDWTSHCYEVEDGESIVGVLEENVWRGDQKDPNGVCTLCLNPNNCASNYYDSEADIKADLDADPGCGACVGNIESGSCTVYGSSGRPDGDKEKDTPDDERKGGPGNNGKGNGNQGKGGPPWK
jgi:hypothetical protein